MRRPLASIGYVLGLALAAAIGTSSRAWPAPDPGGPAIGWSQVTRWLIEYEAEPVPPTRGARVHRLMAVAEPGEFYHFSAHGPESHPWQVDPFRQEYWITGGRTYHHWPFNRVVAEGRIAPGDALGGTIPADLLLGVIPRWPLTDYRPPVDQATGTPMIPGVALGSGDYLLESECDLVSGVRCRVFDRQGIDRLWLADEGRDCLLRRDIRDRESRRLLQRIEAAGLREVAKGLWLPDEFRSQFFSRGQDGSDVLVQQFAVRILRCEIDQAVDGAVFRPSFRPGTLQNADGRSFVQISPGGLDLLDEIVDFLVRYAGMPSPSVPTANPLPWFTGGILLGICLAVIVKQLRLPAGRLDQPGRGG